MLVAAHNAEEVDLQLPQCGRLLGILCNLGAHLLPNEAHSNRFIISLVTLFLDESLFSDSNCVICLINSLFIAESVIKIISIGFIMDFGSYLRDSFNCLDFLIIIFSILNMSVTNNNL